MIRATIFATLLLAASAFAQSQPNFSGTWKVNLAKSDFGMLPPPENRTDVIEHSGDSVNDKVSAVNQQGKQDYVLTFKTDGGESVSKIADREMKITAKWDGPVLAVKMKLSVQGQDIDIQSKWTLSADGSILTQNVHLASAMGETDQKVVYEKQ
jgi:hypothetical protein